MELESISPKTTELPLHSEYISLCAKDSRERTENVQLTSSRQVKLDVGGFKYSTTLTTLTADPNSMLAAMFSGRFPVEKNEEGCVFIDRDGRYFHHILNWLRNGNLPPFESGCEQQSLLMEAKYYQIISLVEFLSGAESLPQVEGTIGEKFTLKEILLLVNSVPSKKKVQLPSTDLNQLTLDGIHLPGGIPFVCYFLLVVCM
jgi:BTB/POZ domain-containing protein KCTD9